jgi:hypothetical protein
VKIFKQKKLPPKLLLCHVVFGVETAQNTAVFTKFVQLHAIMLSALQPFSLAPLHCRLAQPRPFYHRIAL